MKSNQELQRDVMDALKWEPQLTASDFGVSARDGIVTLSGIVDSYPKKLAAERAAKNVAGVRAVAEDIEVKIGSSSVKTDTEIAQAVVHALKWNESVPDSKIKATVDNGWVKLEGEVEWSFQKEAARKAVQYLSGVSGLTNLITVKPRVAATDVQRKIRKAFERSAMLDSNGINSEVDNSTVILKGHVRSWAEWEDAEHAAWCCPGVTKVDNRLKVDVPIEVY